MMTTDSERRDAARRLRGLDYADLQESLICAYLDALGIEGYADWVGIAHRLADLIEPSWHECVPGECPINVRRDSDRIDRDALLELADAMEGHASDVFACRNSVNSRDLNDYARLIREALGVES